MELAAIFQFVFGWMVSKFLDGLFPKRRRNEAVLKALAEKDKQITQLTRQRGRQEKEKHRLLKSLMASGISTKRLVEKYDRPLLAILISYANQKDVTSTGGNKKSQFVLDELQKYNVKYLGGTDALIPPAYVPARIKNSDDLRQWFEQEVLKGRWCKVKFLVLVDLKSKVFWDTRLPYVQIEPKHRTVGEVLTTEDLFTEEQIQRIALADIIRDGDIALLATHTLSAEELHKIHRNQSLIERKLGNPTLRELARDEMESSLSEELTELGIACPSEVAHAIVSEAKFWTSWLKQ